MGKAKENNRYNHIQKKWYWFTAVLHKGRSKRNMCFSEIVCGGTSEVADDSSKLRRVIWQGCEEPRKK